MSDILQAMAVAVTAAPDNAVLRVQYARMLLDAGQPAPALEQASTGLRLDPTSAEALDLVTRSAARLTGTGHAVPTVLSGPPEAPPERFFPDPEAPVGSPHAAAPAATPVEPSVETDASSSTGTGSGTAIDWARLENEIGNPIETPFVDSDRETYGLVPAQDTAPDPADFPIEVARETVTLADVGGLESVKQRIREAFLEPMRNQEIAKAFGKSLRGGLLLYGPPGVGKTYMARAVAGELGAHFITVTLADILDKYIGQSEQNLHHLFQRARQLAPAVLFLDELDAIGGRRAQYSGSSGMRTVVNQLLQEMDGMGSDNDGLFVLGATNHPWDVDTALLRPGRFDRVVLVLPPDAPARDAILRHHFQGRPIAGIRLDEVVKVTDGFSGADLAHVVATAAEKAMMASIRTGDVQPIGMADVRTALKEIKPSTTAWLQSARNVVTFANADGRYDELAAYLRARKIL